MMESRLTPRNRAPTADFSLAIINVVFLLLFFFILTGSVVQRNEMNVQPPLTKKLPLERLPRPLIAISNDNELFLDGQLISLEVLLSQIALAKQNEDGTFPALNILADSDLSAKTFLATVDSLRMTGLTIRIVTIRTAKDRRENR